MRFQVEGLEIVEIFYATEFCMAVVTLQEVANHEEKGEVDGCGDAKDGVSRQRHMPGPGDCGGNKSDCDNGQAETLREVLAYEQFTAGAKYAFSCRRFSSHGFN
ncbi:MAG: hypothetical protein CMJ70_20405 [Planctomycetaceae bacterium]|nr:hypothetical protein [Planctomycetaceae bacterium]HAA73432.1 hypothetical protein [Planctomycetaceae bacterium]